MEKVFINGLWVEPAAGAKRQIRNPANRDVLGTTVDCEQDLVNSAVESAKKAQKTWKKIPGVEKAVYLRAVAAKIREDGQELAKLLTLETGKPLCESHDCVDWVAACFDYYAEVGRQSYGNSVPPVAPHQINFTIKEPYGVVAAIVPFNFPLLLLSWKLAPALAAGNAVVCKPPHQNPLSTLRLARALEGLPPGVVNVITGAGATGEKLTSHPSVDCIAFTGSTDVGRKIAANAGAMMKKVNLELGGIDPMIIFKDADLDVAVQGAAWARLLNAGQVCTSSKRIYVEKSIAAEFTDRLIKHVKTLKMGDPMSHDTDIGPLISEEALTKVDAQVKQAIKEGAEAILGGKPVPGAKGYFYEATVLNNVRHGSVCTTEEIFGPVISLIVAQDEDHAIEMANDSIYGLGATIFTNNLKTSMKAMENIKAGTFWINDPLSDNDAAPFGGMRASGVGRELGEEGLDAFREPKHVHLDYVMEAKSYWFPYSKRGHK